MLSLMMYDTTDKNLNISIEIDCCIRMFAFSLFYYFYFYQTITKFNLALIQFCVSKTKRSEYVSIKKKLYTLGGNK